MTKAIVAIFGWGMILLVVSFALFAVEGILLLAS